MVQLFTNLEDPFLKLILIDEFMLNWQPSNFIELNKEYFEFIAMELSYFDDGQPPLNSNSNFTIIAKNLAFKLGLLLAD